MFEHIKTWKVGYGIVGKKIETQNHICKIIVVPKQNRNENRWKEEVHENKLYYY